MSSLTIERHDFLLTETQATSLQDVAGDFSNTDLWIKLGINSLFLDIENHQYYNFQNKSFPGIPPRSPGEPESLHFDDLTIVSRTDLHPHDSIGLLFIKVNIAQPDEEADYRYATGTAFLTEDNVLITAAHNVYMTQKNKWAENVLFYPANAPDIGIKIASASIYREWRDEEVNRIEFDYAVLEPESFDNLVASGLPFHPSIYDDDIDCRIFGYPDDRSGFQFDKYSLWRSIGKSITLYSHYCPFQEGASGGPWLKYGGFQPYVIGLSSSYGKDVMYSPFLDDNFYHLLENTTDNLKHILL